MEPKSWLKQFSLSRSLSVAQILCCCRKSCSLSGTSKNSIMNECLSCLTRKKFCSQPSFFDPQNTEDNVRICISALNYRCPKRHCTYIYAKHIKFKTKEVPALLFLIPCFYHFFVCIHLWDLNIRLKPGSRVNISISIRTKQKVKQRDEV